MGVELSGQVQGGVGGIQVVLTPAAIGEAGDDDLAKDRLQWADMVGLDAWPPCALGVEHLAEAFLACCTQVQVVLVELSDQVTDIDCQPRLEIAVGEAARLGAAHEPTHLLEAGAARAEGIIGTAGQHGELPRSVSPAALSL